MLNVDDISLVQQCRWLESHFLHDSGVRSITDISIVKEAEPILHKLDEIGILRAAADHPSLANILKIPNWLQVWDMALDRGCAGTVAVQKLLRFLSEPLFGDRKCKRCLNAIEPHLTFADHVITCQSLPALSVDHLISAVNNVDDSIFIFSKLIT